MEDLETVNWVSKLNFREQNLFRKRKLDVFLACGVDDDIKLVSLLVTLPEEYQRNILNSRHDNITPLIYAVRQNSRKVFDYLLSKSPNIIDLEIMGSILVDPKDLNSRVEGAPVLWIASALNRIDMVRKLVEKGAYIDHASRSGSTPLRCASYDGHLEICKYLVKNGADLRAVNDCDQSPLMIASAMGKDEVVKYLLSVGADINQKTSQGDTALHITVEVATEEVVRVLLEVGAKNEADCFGFTPLMLSAAYRKLLNFKLLLKYCQIFPYDLVDALKILGAVFAIDERESEVMSSWREAECVRIKTGILLNLLPDIPLYQGISEPKSACELICICENRTIFYRNNSRLHLMLMGLCVFERLFGSYHPHTSHYIRVCGDLFLQIPNEENYAKCMDFWLRAFQFEKIRFGFEINAAVDLLISLDTFIDMQQAGFYPVYAPFIKWGIGEMRNIYTRETYLKDLILVITYYFTVWQYALIIFANSQPQMVGDDTIEIRELVREVLEVKRRGCFSIMHFALGDIKEFSRKYCMHDFKPFVPDSNLHLFVECGEDINVRHPVNGGTLLHTAIHNNCRLNTFESILKLDCYPFTCDYEGNTIFDYIKMPCYSALLDRFIIAKIKELKYKMSLKTLSTLAVLKYEIPYKVMPETLQRFIMLHTRRSDCITLKFD